MALAERNSISQPWPIRPEPTSPNASPMQVLKYFMRNLIMPHPIKLKRYSYIQIVKNFLIAWLNRAASPQWMA
jgi:hypothetical protein